MCWKTYELCWLPDISHNGAYLLRYHILYSTWVKGCPCCTPRPLYTGDHVHGFREISKSRDWVSVWFHRSLHAPRQQCCRVACQISERLENFNLIFCGLEFSRDVLTWFVCLLPSRVTAVNYSVTVRRVMWWWFTVVDLMNTPGNRELSQCQLCRDQWCRILSWRQSMVQRV